jgi:hypothetical protein
VSWLLKAVRCEEEQEGEGGAGALREALLDACPGLVLPGEAAKTISFTRKPAQAAAAKAT